MSLFLSISFGAVLFYVVARSADGGPLCPPLASHSVHTTCQLRGEPVADCATSPSAPGTRATFRCKPLYQLLFGYEPAAGHESECGPDGQWTVLPYRCVPICGQRTGVATAFVRGGENATSASQFPWHATIYRTTTSADRMQQICGGSLVTPKYVVSAAHCFYHNGSHAYLPLAKYRVAFGKIYRSAELREPNEVFRELARIHVKEFGGERLHYTNDIALLELAEEVAMTKWTLPVCVDWARKLPALREGTEGLVAGFGNSPDAFGPLSEILKFAKFPYIPLEKCKDLVSKELAAFSLQTDKICFVTNGSVTVAKGDSGGGLTFYSEGSWHLRGVVSVGKLNSLDGESSPSAFFTHVAEFIPWMQDTIRRGEVSGEHCGVDIPEESVVDGAPVGARDFPWEVDIFLKRTAGDDYIKVSGGTLIKPNLVITAATSLLHTAEVARIFNYAAKSATAFRITDYPASSLRVSPRLPSVYLTTGGNISEVVRVLTGDRQFVLEALFTNNFALLELRQHLNLMPVCLDTNGRAFRIDKTIGTAVLEEVTLNRHNWTRKRIQTAAQCNSALDKSHWKISDEMLCTILPADPMDGTVITVNKTTNPEDRMYRNLMVNVDSVWYLRGVRSARYVTVSTQSDVSLYTDLSNKLVQKSLADTIEMLGRPNCGDVRLCEHLSFGQALRGHMPWTVEVRNAVHDTKTRVAGLLIQHNVVLTSLSHTTAPWSLVGHGRAIPDVHVPTSNMSVLWTDSQGRTKTSKVLRISTHQSRLGIPIFVPDLVLLELDPATPVSATPACLDLSGNTLQKLGSGYLGLVESWNEWDPDNHNLTKAQYGTTDDCEIISTPQFWSFGRGSRFCVKGRVSPGNAYLVQYHSKWFLQGLMAFRKQGEEGPKLKFAIDFSSADIRLWLREELSKIKMDFPEVPKDKTVEVCRGKPHGSAQCGTLPLSGPEREDISKIKLNHLPWNVAVYPNAAERHLTRAGTVLHPRVVLTVESTSYTPRIVTETNATVEYRINADDEAVYPLTRVKVKSIHYGRHGLALMELEDAVAVMPVCLPRPKSVNELASHETQPVTGIVEFWDIGLEIAEASSNVLVPSTPFRSEHCRALLPRYLKLLFSCDKFFIDPSGNENYKTLTSLFSMMRLGNAFSALTDGFWYVRGVATPPTTSDARKDAVLPFYNLDNPEDLAWIEETITTISAKAE